MFNYLSYKPRWVPGSRDWRQPTNGVLSSREGRGFKHTHTAHKKRNTQKKTLKEKPKRVVSDVSRDGKKKKKKDIPH